MSDRRWLWRPEILVELERLGFSPRPSTSPQLVRDSVKLLQNFEIRGLRGERLALEARLGPQPLEPYRERVRAVTAKYRVLATPPETWAVESSTPAGPPSRTRR